ncbi:Arm DNA-binding domain-containing protein [Flavobacterium sp. Arc2]|uniref:Arm DNA-binding domain-containing protein n=1 Tax=Flavobacterium sp. Arc2 TaxID=3046685 RepID=UPI00352D7228
MDAPISILFYVKRAKVNAQGLVPIFQRITINRQRLDNSTGKFVDPEKWHSEMSKMKGTSEEARSLNGHLDQLKSKILNIEKNLIKKDIPITFETFKNEFQGKKERERMLIPIFQEHNRKIKELGIKRKSWGLSKKVR